MKIICVSKEYDYEYEVVIPVEYSSINDLVKNIEGQRAAWAIANEECIKKNELLSAQRQSIYNHPDFIKAREDLVVTRKTYNRHSNTSRIQRDANWRAERGLLEKNIVDIGEIITTFESQLMENVCHKPDPVIIGKRYFFAHGSSVDDGEIINSMEFYSLEEWFEKNKG